MNRELLQEIDDYLNEKLDRCARIAKRKYRVWPSAYASGAVVKCRQGKIWKGLKEEIEEEIDGFLNETKKRNYKPDFSREKAESASDTLQRLATDDQKLRNKLRMHPFSF